MRDSLASKEIALIRHSGKKIQNRFFTGYCIRSEKNGIAVAVSKKVGPAVQRNKIKRRIREAYRSAVRKLTEKVNFRIVFYPKISVIKANFVDLISSIETALDPASGGTERI